MPPEALNGPVTLGFTISGVITNRYELNFGLHTEDVPRGSARGQPRFSAGLPAVSPIVIAVHSLDGIHSLRLQIIPAIPHDTIEVAFQPWRHVSKLPPNISASDSVVALAGRLTDHLLPTASGRYPDIGFGRSCSLPQLPLWVFAGASLSFPVCRAKLLPANPVRVPWNSDFAKLWG